MTAAPAAVIRPTFPNKAAKAVLEKLDRPGTIAVFPVKAPGKKRRGPEPLPLQTRIDRLTDKSRGPEGVWMWLGSRSQSNGYPQISYRDTTTGKRVTRQVHRVIMELKLGRPLDIDEHVLHERGCPKVDVNPKHLRVGTHQDNMDDATAEGRMTGRKITAAAAMEIDMLFHRKGASVDALAHRFGVCNQTIKKIVTGRTHSKATGRVYVPGKTGRPPKLKLVKSGKGRTRPTQIGAVA